MVLLDEAEKAAPEVLNLFLQILSAGRLTDATGTTVDFRHSLVVLTSNLGNSAAETIVPNRAEYRAQIERALRSELRPELLGRMDAIVVFHRVELEHIRTIVRIKLSDLASTIRGVSRIEPTSAAVQSLAEESWSPDAGARAIDTILAQRIDPAIAMMIERGQLNQSSEAPLQLDFDGSDYVYRIGHVDFPSSSG